MKAVYLETSAMLALLFNEAEAADVRRSLEDADDVATSALTFLEAERGIVRLEHSGKLSAHAANKLRAVLEAMRESLHVLAISESVQQKAMRRFPVEPVRTLDAIHLASAIQLIAAFPDLSMLSFDDRILQNAKALQLT